VFSLHSIVSKAEFGSLHNSVPGCASRGMPRHAAQALYAPCTLQLPIYLSGLEAPSALPPLPSSSVPFSPAGRTARSRSIMSARSAA